MKISKYNFIFVGNNAETTGTIIYNSRTGAMATLDSEHFSLFDDFCKSGTPKFDKEFELGLLNCGFIIEDNVDEQAEIRLNMLRSQFATSGMGLTIAPTMDCNFGCAYCFEVGQLKECYMSDEVEDKIVEFVAQHANSLEMLNITWFGGEPLLTIDRIESLSKRFIDICEQNNVAYSSNVITNGYYFTPEIAERLKVCKVEYAQITIDGMKETHDKRRFLKNKENGENGSFDVILQNIELSKNILY